MKILHVIVGLNVGGAELMLKRLIEAQLRSGVIHEVVSLTDTGTVGRQLLDLGVRVHALKMNSALDVPRAVIQLVRRIQDFKPDLVQTWMYHADLLGGVAARLAGNRKIIWGIRTTDVRVGGARATSFVRGVCARLSKHIPHTIVCAARASLDAHANVGYDRNRMVVVPNGFDTAKIYPDVAARSALRKALGIGEDAIVVGTLGRFNRAKDHQNFVRAAGLIGANFEHVRFLMIGRGLDSANAELNAWIRETGHQDRFVLLGQRSDVRECLAAMDIFCLSSRTEGFPNVVGEAMAAALPSVVTDVGDAGLLVGDTGVVVPKEDSAALASGLQTLLEMPATERAAMGKKALHRVNVEFTMEKSVTLFNCIYDEVVQNIKVLR